MIYFQIITVEYIDHVVICIFHVLICTDHVVVCRIIQYANKNSSATDKVFMRYRSIIYLGRSGQPSRFLCQVRRPTLRDSLSSLNGYSCKTRKRTTVFAPHRSRSLVWIIPERIGRDQEYYTRFPCSYACLKVGFPSISPTCHTPPQNSVPFTVGFSRQSRNPIKLVTMRSMMPLSSSAAVAMK